MDNTTYSNALIAIFADRASAEQARDELLRRGLRREDIEVTTAAEASHDAASGNTGLTGTAPSDSSGGGISGWFHRLFGDDESDDDRTYYSEATRDGRYAVMVNADERTIDTAAEILNGRGAISLDEKPVASRQDYTSGSRNASLPEGEHAEIPVVNEELRVGKRAVQRGGVRIYSRVREQPVEENISLREEHVRVDRRPVDRAATEADIQAASRGVIEVTETIEEPIIEKRARVVEEVVVNREVSERTENVRDTVRRTDVRVEDARGDRTGSGTTNYDADFQNDFRTRFGNSDRYEDYAPAYRYGYDMASDPRYRGRSFDEVERDLRTDYERQNPNSAWERMKDSIRYGWDKVTGRR